MKKILFDTDVLIEHLRDNPSVTTHIKELHQSGVSLAYTPISEAEIYRGLRSHERGKTEWLLSHFECLNIDHKIGRRAGEYLRSYAKSHGLEVPDALIAASTFVHRFALCTLNWKHYPMTDLQKYRIEF